MTRTPSITHDYSNERISDQYTVLLDELDHPDTSLVSFDVFDTVLTRNMGDPTTIFLMVGQRLHKSGVIKCSPETYARYRYTCEQRVRANNYGREVTLREICDEMVCFWDIEDQVDDLIKTEIDVERNSIAAIPSMRTIVDKVRKKYGRVVFVSDMYLPSGFIEEQLDKYGLLGPDDSLYVSSAYGVQKGDGRLFDILLNEERLLPSQLLHCGNSSRYDVLPARKLGIRVYHFDQGNPNPSEEVLNSYSMQTEGYASHIAGAARKARLAGLQLDSLRRVVWDTATSVTGPLVLLYAHWIIRRAKYKDINKLYFLARDAYLPYLAVKAILDQHPELEMEARYLYGSRPTYYVLGIQKLGSEEWRSLTTHAGHKYQTIKDLQTCLMAQDDTFDRHLGQLGLNRKDQSRRLTSEELESIRNLALENEDFNSELLGDIKLAQDLQRRYLLSEGIESSSKVALVDSGWTSRSHAPLYNFIVREGCKSVRIFYIGLMVENTHIPLESIDTFMFNLSSKQGRKREGMYYPRPSEILFMSAHGRTRGFIERGGNVIPEFADIENADFVERNYEVYQAGVEAFLEEARASSVDADAFHDLRDVAERLLHRFWMEPTEAEVMVWSQISWEWDPLGMVKYPLARPYRITDAWKAFCQKRLPDCHVQFWVAAAKQSSPRGVIAILKAAVVLRRVTDRVYRILPGTLRNQVRKFGKSIIYSYKQGE